MKTTMGFCDGLCLVLVLAAGGLSLTAAQRDLALDAALDHRALQQFMAGQDRTTTPTILWPLHDARFLASPREWAAVTCARQPAAKACQVSR